MALSSPLRYPGSKQRLIPEVVKFVEKNFLAGMSFVEAYAGGASVSLGLLSLDIVQSVDLVEYDPLVSAFWRAVFLHTDELVGKIDEMDVSLETWTRLGPFREDASSSSDVLEAAVACIFFNRTNYSGVLGAGPIGGQSQSSGYMIDCRFNKSEITRRIRAAARYKDRVRVHHADAVEFLAHADLRNSWVYLDPPYHTVGRKLYRYKYEDLDHLRLRNALCNLQAPWLLSYNLLQETVDLYRNFDQTVVRLPHSARTSKSDLELLVTNEAFPEVGVRDVAPSQELAGGDEPSLRGLGN